MVSLSPQSQTAIAGNNASLSLSARAPRRSTYQWWLSGSPVGGNSPTLLLSNIQPAQAGNYWVRLTNAYGAATSSVATLTVNYALNTPANGSGTVDPEPEPGGLCCREAP